MSKTKVYLDIDGVLLANELHPALHAKEFILYVVENYDVYWLTTHCQGDASHTVRHLSNLFDDETEQYRASKDQLNNKVSRVDYQLKVLYEDRLDGRISPELYDSKFQEKTAERKELIKSLERLTDENSDYIQKGIDILDLTQNAAEIFKTKSIEEQRILLGDIFSGITLNGKHMTVIWRPETEVVRKAVEKTNQLENFLEPSSDSRKMGLSEPCRSIWLPLHTSISNLSLEFQVDGSYLKGLAQRLGIRRPALLGATV